MKRLFFITILAVVFNSVQAQKQPNIIWLMAEDMSTDLECYGMPDVKTPHLNKMAKNGVLFNNAFVTNPICSPSRSSMMVGTHQLKTIAKIVIKNNLFILFYLKTPPEFG